MLVSNSFLHLLSIQSASGPKRERNMKNTEERQKYNVWIYERWPRERERDGMRRGEGLEGDQRRQR
jgi:hypothetical protein